MALLFYNTKDDGELMRQKTVWLVMSAGFYVGLFLMVRVGRRPLYAADSVVGTGTPASCTEAAFDAALSTVQGGSGTITFNCGGAATLLFTSGKRE
jgi:hypothetical protein